MEIYLAHPGENDGNFLTPNGIWQVQTLARRLNTEGFKFRRVYSNGHNVSKQTAEILSRAIESPVVHDERFVELNKSFIEGSLVGYESENLEYIHMFVEEVLARREDTLITLGDGIHRAIISRLTGMPLASTRHFSLSPASLSIMKYYPSGNSGVWRMSIVNDLNHLRLP